MSRRRPPAVKKWKWSCAGCSRKNERLVRASDKGGEVIRVACRWCGRSEERVVMAAELLPLSDESSETAARSR